MPPDYLSADIPNSERTRVRAAHALPERYLFYPAQFWPHKNHLRIVEAIAQLRGEGVDVTVVFAGSRTTEVREQTFRDVVERARALRVDERVRFLGYLPDEDMGPVYAEAVALVMPTFFGPTNIPVVEAWTVGCPVVTSDIRGIREQCGDAAVLVDPTSSAAVADGIRRVWEDSELVERLRERGRARLGAHTWQDHVERVTELMGDAQRRLQAHEPSRAGARG
jgi:glycosyltransferase involved in cell wall biosynthesis